MKFIKDNALIILIVIAVIILTVVFLAPLLVGTARGMWEWALSDSVFYL
jgi:hypothetical protein